MNHHHELEWRATCEQRQPTQSWARASTCRRPAKRSHRLTWAALVVAVLGFITLIHGA